MSKSFTQNAADSEPSPVFLPGCGMSVDLGDRRSATEAASSGGAAYMDGPESGQQLFGILLRFFGSLMTKSRKS
jgi:hypothetical protein